MRFFSYFVLCWSLLASASNKRALSEDDENERPLKRLRTEESGAELQQSLEQVSLPIDLLRSILEASNGEIAREFGCTCKFLCFLTRGYALNLLSDEEASETLLSEQKQMILPLALADCNDPFRLIDMLLASSDIKTSPTICYKLLDLVISDDDDRAAALRYLQNSWRDTEIPPVLYFLDRSFLKGNIFTAYLPMILLSEEQAAVESTLMLIFMCLRSSPLEERLFVQPFTAKNDDIEDVMSCVGSIANLRPSIVLEALQLLVHYIPFRMGFDSLSSVDLYKAVKEVISGFVSPCEFPVLDLKATGHLLQQSQNAVCTVVTLNIVSASALYTGESIRSVQMIVGINARVLGLKKHIEKGLVGVENILTESSIVQSMMVLFLMRQAVTNYRLLADLYYSREDLMGIRFLLLIRRPGWIQELVKKAEEMMNSSPDDRCLLEIFNPIHLYCLAGSSFASKIEGKICKDMRIVLYRNTHFKEKYAAALSNSNFVFMVQSALKSSSFFDHPLVKHMLLKIFPMLE